MDELQLGEATIVYDDPDGGTTERTVDNEAVVYVRDHWMVRSGADEDGNDLMRQIPKERVHYVERNVEEFESEVSTVRHRVESLANEVRETLPFGGDDERRRRSSDDDGPTRVPVSDGRDDEE